MKLNNWKILYSDYTGPQKRAVELLSREIGKFTLRERGVYSFHVLACEQAKMLIDSNAVVLGTYEQTPLLQKYIQPEEIPDNGYFIRVMDYPDNPQLKMALICGSTAVNVFYGAVEFLDEYLVQAVPAVDSYIRLKNELFLQKLPDYSHGSAPDFRTRSVFTWGHPITDYRRYLEDLARLKLNQVIFWNDFLPVNAEEVVNYAHSFGIEVIWGFAWGWSQNCGKADVTNLETLRDRILEEYHRTYRHATGDGIYFQSFTELPFDRIEGILIADAVTDLVNMTAGAILEEDPGLHIQFGLHASSVRDHLDSIARVDRRVEIVWEDCGTFPFKVGIPKNNLFSRIETSQEQHDFVKQIVGLRDGISKGLVYKGMLTMDWSRGRVETQAGPYVMGLFSQEIVDHDNQILPSTWRWYSTEWLEHGPEALELTQFIRELTDGQTNMCLAGMFSGGIWFPTALCAQMFWNCREPFSQIQRKTLLRDWIKF